MRSIADTLILKNPEDIKPTSENEKMNKETAELTQPLSVGLKALRIF